MLCGDQLDCHEEDSDEDFGSSLLPSSSKKSAPWDFHQIKLQCCAPNGTARQARIHESNSQTTSLPGKVSSSSKDTAAHQRCIIHVDLDCFYAQVEMIRNPDLCAVPLGIQQKYLLVTCNYIARARGVKKLMSIAEARRLCPDICIVNGEDLYYYRQYSDTVHRFMTQYTTKVEKLGLDENFLDVTELVNGMLQDKRNGGQQESSSRFTSLRGHLYNDMEENMTVERLKQTLIASDGHCCDCGCVQRLVAGSHFAQKIRDQLYQTVGFTSCAGIAHNKLLAKMVGELHKPNQQTIIFPSSGRTFLQSSRITKIPGIGYRYSEKLSSLGVSFVRELQALPKVILQKQFGARIANFLAEVAQGIDTSDVGVTREAKSMSEEESFKELRTFDDASKEIRILIGKLIRRLRSRVDLPCTIRLTIRNRKATKARSARESRQMPFDGSILTLGDEGKIKDAVFNIAISLFSKLVDTTQHFDLSLINLCFTNFKTACVKSKGLRLPSLLSLKGRESTESPKLSVLPGCNQNIDSTYTKPLSYQAHEDMENKLSSGEHIFQTTSASEPLNEDQQSITNFDELVDSVVKEKSPPKLQNQAEHMASLPTTYIMKNTAEEGLPANVDRQVFRALPEDIKAQLRLEWSIRKGTAETANGSPVTSSVTMLSSKRKLALNSRTNTKRVKAAGKSKDTTQTDISKFFSK